MFELNNEIEVTFDEIPLPWIPKIELYYPDLPQFPIIYINIMVNGLRVIACPVSVSYDIASNNCMATFTLLTNALATEDVVNQIKNELSERIGYAHKISLNDVIACCNGESKYIELFSSLWNYVNESYGDYIPYGKFYDEHYSIIRFVSAWQPKTGRQSEMRMLYNFMSAFGEEVKMPEKWKHLEFYVIPNLVELKSKNFEHYPKFDILNNAMKKLYNEFFDVDVTIENITFKVMKKAWKQNKDDFITLVTDPLFFEGKLTDKEKQFSERLVDAFNRHAWRAAFYISSFMNVTNNYEDWSKEFFVKFYSDGNKLKGYSEKVIACFLQQGFLNMEVIPIDTWIKTFYEFPLGINNNADFFDKFSSLGKLERVIWLSSQSNKTNMRAFFDILWCQRYGTIGNGELRGINPIACYSCKLKDSCVGANSYKNKKILLIEDKTEQEIHSLFKKDDIDFVVSLKKKIPEKCYFVKGHELILIDEFSGYILNDDDRIDSSLISKHVIDFNNFVFGKES